MSQAYSSGGLPGAPLTGDPGTLDLPWYGIGFGDAVKRFFQKYARFDGRASRGEYWWVVLAGFLLGVAISIIGGIVVNAALGGASQEQLQQYAATGALPGGVMAFYGVVGLINLALLIPSIAVTVRRLHDANLSGFYVLLSLLPCIGSLVVLILCVQSSNPKGMRFDR